MEYIQLYIEYLKKINYSENTCLSSQTILNHFKKFCESQGIIHEKEVTEKTITLYINEIITKVQNQIQNLKIGVIWYAR